MVVLIGLVKGRVLGTGEVMLSFLIVRLVKERVLGRFPVLACSRREYPALGTSWRE